MNILQYSRQFIIIYNSYYTILLLNQVLPILLDKYSSVFKFLRRTLEINNYDIGITLHTAVTLKIVYSHII